ncbi:hypothetical protein ACEUZ9_002221 [Paracoccus litorisediminis]|uniref:hypothetical protein n=1 Tax=Paracoccus litorisediminis TaxID=2006130 RepID=UPI003732379B
MKILPALAVALALSACGTTDYIGTKPMAFAHDGHNFRVYDMPADNRLMITPSISESVTMPYTTSWFGQDLAFADAAQAYLTPRNCQVTNVRLLVKPQYEVEYSC